MSETESAAVAAQEGRRHMLHRVLRPPGRPGVVVSAGEDECISWFDLHTKYVLLTIEAANKPISSICFKPGKEDFVYASAGSEIFSFDVRMGPQSKPLETYNYNRDEINQIAVRSKGFLAAAEDSGDVKIVSTIQKCLYKRLREAHTSKFAAVYNSFLGDLGQVSGGWHIDGQKRWIGNNTFAYVLVVLARNADIKQLNGFIVRKGAPGLNATKIENKIGRRMVQNGDIVFNKVFVSEVDRLPDVNSFQDISKVLAISRIMVAWQPIGISIDASCWLESMQALRVRESDARPRQYRKVLELQDGPRGGSLGRELLGGNGILADFLVAKPFCDLEPIYSYEGTYDINSLVTSREMTGIASFKPAALAKARL